MNWKLILQLSGFGLAMAIGTVFVVPSTVEPFLWLAIFVVCALVLATRCRGRFFLHGFLVSVVNSVWMTTAHVLLFDQYVANHPQEVEMMKSMPMPDSPRLMMAMTGPVIGVVAGLVLGVFTVIAARLVNRRPQTT